MTTEEQKKADETAAAEAEAKAKEKEKADADFEASIANLSDEEKEAKRAERQAQNNDNRIDYKKLAEEERKKREEAEKALANKRFKESEKKRKQKEENGEDPDEEDDDDENPPVTRKEFNERLEKEREIARREMQAERIKEIADELAESEDEANYIIEIHKNRSFPSHLTLEEQLEECHAIANRKRFLSKNKELGRALNSKNNASNGGGSPHRDPMEGSAPKLESSLESSLKRSGFSYNNTKRCYEKKLPSGKFLYKDPKSKKTWVGN